MAQPKRPRDTNQLAKLIVDLSTGEVATPEDTRNPAAVALGAIGGKRGGANRMAALSPDERKALALKAANARWKKAAPAVQTGAAKVATRKSVK